VAAFCKDQHKIIKNKKEPFRTTQKGFIKYKKYFAAQIEP
jgi:hypothetical protein